MKLYIAIFAFSVSCCVYKKVNDTTTKLIKVLELINHHKIDSAEVYFKNKVLYNNENDFDYKMLEIIINFKRNKHTESLGKCLSLLEKYPETSVGFYYAGLNEYSLRRPEKALSYLIKASFIGDTINGFIYIDPQKKEKHSNIFFEGSASSDISFMIATCYTGIGDYLKSQSLLQSCVDRGYKIPECYVTMGYNCEKLGDLANANKFYSLAKNLIGTHADEVLENIKIRSIDSGFNRTTN